MGAVVPELESIVAEIREYPDDEDYVLPAQRWRDPGLSRAKGDRAKQPSSAQALYYLVKRVAARAGSRTASIRTRCAMLFANYIARSAGVQNAQAMLGHASIGTTQGYLGAPTLDELTAAVKGRRFAEMIERVFSPLLNSSLTQ